MYFIPQPQEMRLKEGTFCITYQTRITVAGNSGEQAVKHGFLLQKELEKCLGYRLPLTRGTEETGCIYLDVLPKKQQLGWERDEGYLLQVTPEGIRLTGADTAGLFYAIQTLLQMTKQKGAVLDALEIRDFPSIPNRGFYHDVTRGRIPTLAYMKKLADRLASYKMNQLQLYIEHSFFFQHFSEMWRDDTPITPEEILELDAYCKERHIELVPSISTFGHLYKMLGCKSWNHLCELDGWQGRSFSFVDRMLHHTIDVSNPESIELIQEMLREFMPLFSSGQLNICGDETFDLGKGKSRRLAEKTGLQEMYIGYIKQLCTFVIENGKRPMFWGDIVCHFPEAIKELPPETICLNWGYAPDQSEDSTRALQEAGAVQYVCPGVSGWNQLMNQMRTGYENIVRMVSYAGKYGAIGVLNTDWGDYGHINHPDFSIPGMIYGAAFSWSGTEKGTLKSGISFEEMNRQISRLEYGDSAEKLVSLMAELAENSVFDWGMAVRFMEAEESRRAEEKVQLASLLSERDIQEKNCRIRQLIQELYGCIARTASEKREYIKPCVVAAEGILIFNRIGMAVAADHLENTLAEELERWFYEYKQLWRSVSRESELFRIQNVINWYGDYLRDIK